MDESPEQLLARYSEAKQKLAKARAQFVKQLKDKGIEPGFITEERKDDFRDSWESYENACRQGDPPVTVVWIDQPEFADYQHAKWKFESVQADCLKMFEGMMSDYEAWQKKWQDHFHKKYGLHPAGGFGSELDADTAKQFTADLQRMKQEDAEWKAKLSEPKVPVPPGWEGQRPGSEIKTLADLATYLSEALRRVREFGLDKSNGPFAEPYLEAGRVAIRNAYRILGQLEIFDRPAQPTDIDEPFKLEAALSDLLAWVCRNAVAESDALNTDDVNEFLGLAEEIVARIEETKGPEWWTDVAQLSRQLEEVRRRIGFPKWTLDEPQLPAFYVTSVHDGCELYGIDAEFAGILQVPVGADDIYASGVMLLGDPMADRCGQICDLWRQYRDSPQLEYINGTADEALLHLRRWIRTFTRMIEGKTAEAAASTGAQQTVPSNASADAAHSDDFRSVLWYGEQYAFTATQAACVKVLWRNWQQRTPVISEVTILDEAGSAGDRLRDVFDKGKHPAWGTMIVTAGKGAFQLADMKKS